MAGGEQAPAVRVTVAVEAPRRVALGASSGLLDYTSERALAPGTVVRVPLGRREVAGVVWDGAAAAALPLHLRRRFLLLPRRRGNSHAAEAAPGPALRQ
ncbi:MAG: hypothetical protein U1F25_03770 [Rubrivivax sp.]